MKTVFASAIVSLSIAATPAYSADAFILKLVDPLDEPEFYCLDVTGHGPNTKVQDPLQAHTCKSGLAADQTFVIVGDTYQMPAYNLCLTASASGATALAGSALLLRACDGRETQNFRLLASGHMVMLNDTNLCIAAGSSSTEAAGPSHMWRAANLQACDSTEQSLITWTTE